MSIKSLLKISVLLISVMSLGACSVTKNIAEDQYVLKKNIIKTDHEVKRKNRIKQSEINKYIKQKPAGNILGIRTWIYDKANPEKENWWNNTLRKIGTRPVILDTTLTASSAENIKHYMDSRGYFQSEESYSFKTDTTKRKTKVIYTSHQGIPYTISQITYDYKDGFMEKLMQHADSAEMLRIGDILDNNLLNQERQRINDYLKNTGYYNFSIDNIRFVVDTTLGDHKAKVTVVINRSTPARGQDTTYSPIYRIKTINIYPDYDASAAMNDPDYLNTLDTVTYDGINILYHDKLNIRPEVLRKLIYINPNNIYKADEVDRTYSSIVSQTYFRSASIVFSHVTNADNQEQRTITYTSSDSEELISTRQAELICEIRCIPALRQSFSIETELSTTSNFYGLSATFGYQNRNLFKGVEVFDMSIKAGYELLKNKGSRDSYEFGAQSSLTFPSFLAPVDFNRNKRLRNPKTTLELSVNLNKRPYYNRILSSATFGYSWNNGRHSTYQIKPIDINIVKLNYISQDFLDKLQNPYLRNSYTSQFMAGMSGSYLYNNQNLSASGNSLVIRLNWETMGNLLYGIKSLTSSLKGDPYYKIMGIRFAEYARFDASIIQTIMLGDVTSIAGRIFGGYGFTYGNSKDASLPFDRFFYAGGLNSMRGWMVRTLGPGSSSLPNDMTYPSQLGNVRLEANLEFRFPVWESLHGALFFDAGNVWYTGDESLDENSVFKFDSFLGQLGFNTGVGIRLDFKVTVIRLDWGIQLHNPNKPAGERWIHDFRTNNMALNFGIGYPF